MLKRALKRIFPGIYWQNPVINRVYRLIDPLDRYLRARRGLAELPDYSIRVRSNGTAGQFGGQRFAALGKLLAGLLQQHAGVTRASRVLEIGCGCGRTGIALADILADGGYTGMDIEAVSLAACRELPLFRRKRFAFERLDVHNAMYNPQGAVPAAQYRFPRADGSFDAIFLVSVFTHMPTADVKQYIAEISRLLAPGGSCMLTVFLVDQGRNHPGLSFPHALDEHVFHNTAIPDFAVGYHEAFFLREFARHGVSRSAPALVGNWRNNPAVPVTTPFGQDILFFRKPG